MHARHWLGNDGYRYILFCTKADAFEIISHFGPEAKAPTLRAEDGVKYSHYIVNSAKKIITPVRNLNQVFGQRAEESPVGKKCSVALFLDGYCFREYPSSIMAERWTGPGDYDRFLTLTKKEMVKMSDHYGIDHSSWLHSSFDDQFYCLASLSRKALALLPFLSIAFGGMYDELPMEGPAQAFCIDYDAYTLEEFSDPRMRV